MSIGKRIVRLRERRGWNQADLAELSGVKQSLLSRLERGSRPNPTADILRKLAQTLGCTTDYLIGMHEDDDAEMLPTALAVAASVD